MNSNETTLEISLNEEHTRVAVIIGDSIVAFRPYDALTISAELLDSIVGADEDDHIRLSFPGTPHIAATASDVRAVARAIAAAADQVLEEADLEF